MRSGTALVGAFLAGVALIGAGWIGGRSAPSAEGNPGGTFAVRDVWMFDGTRVIDRTNVVVRDGRIATVGTSIPAGIDVVDGAGRTLLPGLIDAHTHAFGDALQRALVFGVTTELDMFTDHRFAARMRAEQQSPAGAAGRADLLSAGTLVTSPGGHGTEYGLAIPTLTSTSDADAFVDARLVEGSDYIKIVLDDGASYGRTIPTISIEMLRATIAATRRRNKLALVHVGARRAAEQAIDAGASGLIHLFADAPADAGFVGRVVAAGTFVTPTLAVIESITGTAGGRSLSEDARLRPFINTAERAALSATFPIRPGSPLRFEHALGATKMLHDAGVPVLAGTDAPNPGTAHGVSLHRELELLVTAGLSPLAALQSATSVPARVFGLTDRGRIAPGLRADLLLVNGNPAADLTTLRDVVAIWKAGVPLRREPAAETAAPALASTTGIVSGFDEREIRSEFGGGWHVSTDSFMGGKSEAAIRIVEPGAAGTKGALEITGKIVAGAPYPWAGAMFFPGEGPMAPANLSRFKEIAFRARGDGGEHQLMVFATRLGNIPAVHAFTAGTDWREHAVPFASLAGGLDGSAIKGVLFSAGARPGAFRFEIDDVRFR